jgi:hypothetical protein
MTNEKNILTDTMCLNSTKADWLIATPEDKEEIVGFCTTKLNLRTGNNFSPTDLYELVDELFNEAAIDTTTFLEIMEDSYRSFRDNMGSR